MRRVHSATPSPRTLGLVWLSLSLDVVLLASAGKVIEMPATSSAAGSLGQYAPVMIIHVSFLIGHVKGKYLPLVTSTHDPKDARRTFNNNNNNN